MILSNCISLLADIGLLLYRPVVVARSIRNFQNIIGEFMTTYTNVEYLILHSTDLFFVSSKVKKLHFREILIRYSSDHQQNK